MPNSDALTSWRRGLRRRIRFAKKLLLYIWRFGPWTGSRMLRRLHSTLRFVDVSPAGSPYPLRVRPGTSDVVAFQEVFLDRDYDVDLPLEPKLAVDIGANVGYTAVFLAQRHPGCRVIAVEPEAANFDLLCHNTAPYANIEVIRAALWSRPCRLTLEDATAENYSFRFTENATGSAETAIRGMTLSTILEEHGIPEEDSIDLLKIDIEGAEAEIFSERPDWLDRLQVLMIELHERYSPGCTSTVLSHFPVHRFYQRRSGANTLLIRHPARSA